MSAQNSFLRLSKTTLSTSLAAILCSSGIGIAYGQEDEAADQPEDVIVVTGSRIRRSQYDATNATVAVSAEEMNALGITSAAEMIQQLPSNVGVNTPETNTDSNYFLGATIANLRGLNTYFGTRTLTLVDSRRFPATNNGGGVDLNLIPNALIGRIETVTGGASATYGADAMAGVVNVILDQNITDRRINLSYKTTSEGDGQNIDFSFGTGFQLLDGRGSMQIGYDHMFQEAIDDCTTRDFCARSFGTMSNGTGPQTTHPYRIRNAGSGPEPNREHYVIDDGFRYTTLTTGLIYDAAANRYYTFSEDGQTPIEIYTADSELCGPALTPLQVEWLTEEGYTNGQGGNGDTPYGCGNLSYKNVPLIPETTRDNLYARFEYELESGITIDTEISYGESNSVAKQNSSSRSYDIAGVEILRDNAFLLQGSPEMQAVMNGLIDQDTNGLFSCGFFLAPYGSAYHSETDCGYLYKDFSAQTEQINNTDTDVTRLTLGADGSLFEGGSWTWEAYLSWGQTDTTTTISDWQALLRRNMAYDPVLDPSGEPVCRVLYSDDGSPAYGIDDPNYDPNDTGDVNRQRWLEYFATELGDTATSDEIMLYLTSISNGCLPLNQFGHNMTPDVRDYVYPTVREGSDIEQQVISFSLSGDLWEGIGNAGPLTMAAGLDWNESDVFNLPPDDPVLARDYYVNFGDTWGGVTTNTEAFVEFELPLLRDKPGANYLMINVTDRRVRNESKRTTGDPANATRYTSSWKASMIWQPVDMLNVRITRSYDQRAPSARELYESSTPAQAQVQASEIDNVFNPIGQGENDDSYGFSRFGGNIALDNEVSITQTLGLVFTPDGKIPGFRASVDYLETNIAGGIEQVSYLQVPGRCSAQVELGYSYDEQSYCRQIIFDPPDPAIDPNDPYFTANYPGNEATAYQYSNFNFISSSQENTSPITSRSIDYSVSYFTQLDRGGSISARLIATRYLEQRRVFGDPLNPLRGINVVGQTGSSGNVSIYNGEGGGFGINFNPVPEFSSNLWMTYQKDAFSVTSQLRYLGEGRLNVTDGWIGPGDVGKFTGAIADADTDPVSGQNPCSAVGQAVSCPYDPRLENTVTKSTLPSWTTMNLNIAYDFSRSRRSFDAFESFQVYLNITNVGDRVPGFYSGWGAGGINSTYFSGMGRQYELGLQMTF
jgi:iron complex outermembrane receptor protein